MKVILLKDVKGVGRRFEEKNVSDGHAINLLIPKKLAVAVGSPAAAQIKALKEQEAATHEKGEQALQAMLAELAGTKVEVRLKANEQNHLFEKLTAEKLSELLRQEKGLDIEAKRFVLKSPIKETGTFEVPVRVADGKETKFTLEVIRA